MRKRLKAIFFTSHKPHWWAYWPEFLKAIVLALLVAITVRHFFLEAYRVRGDTMFPSLLAGDTIFINKLSYSTRLPFSTTRLTRLKMPKRGEVVVFALERQDKKRFIKRVIGLPGDEIIIDGTSISINGTRMIGRQLGELRYHTERPGEEVQGVVREAQLGSKQFRIFQESKLIRQRKSTTFHVPGGTVFVMGDNQITLNDPRELNFVPATNLLGRALFVSLSYDKKGGSMRWHRLGKGIE